MAILNDEENVPGLPEREMKLVEQHGTPIGRELPIFLSMRIQRLQSLGYKVVKEAEIDHVELKRISRETGVPFERALKQAIGSYCCALQKREIIELVISELIADAVPSACRSPGRYFMDSKGTIKRKESSKG